MVDSPFAEEPLSATQPATTPAGFSIGGAPRGDAAPSVPTTLVVERDNSAVSPTAALSFPLKAFVSTISSIRETQEGTAADLYPSLLPLPASTSVTHVRRSSAHSGASISPFRLTVKGLPDDGEGKHSSSSKESMVQGTSENVDPVQLQMEQQPQQQEAEASLKNWGSSFVASSVERLASSGRSSPLLEEVASPRPLEAAPVTSSTRAGQHEAAAFMLEQRIDAAWQKHVRSWCSTTSSVNTSISDLRLREETRRNTKRNASPLSARNLRAQLQRQRQQRFRNSSSPLHPQQTVAAASASAPTTPLRFHVTSRPQQRRDGSQGGTPQRTERTGAIAASSAATEAPAGTAVAAAAATPTAERPTTGCSPVRSILRVASGSGNANSLSIRRVVFTPVPKSQRLTAGEVGEASSQLGQRGAAEGETAPGISATAPVEPAGTDADTPVPECGEHRSSMRPDSVPTLEQQQNEDEQQQCISVIIPTEPARHSCEILRRGSATDSPHQHQQQHEQPQSDGSRDESQQLQQQHSEGTQGDTPNAKMQLGAEGFPVGVAATDAAARTATMHAEAHATRTVTLAEPASKLVSAITTEPAADLGVRSEDTEIAMKVRESAPAVPEATVVHSAAATPAEVGTYGGPEAGTKEHSAAQVPRVALATEVQLSTGGTASEAESAGRPFGAEMSDNSMDSVEADANSESVSYCSSSTRVLVVNSEGETELLLRSASCLVAPALSEPLHADPTPLRKAPLRPPSGPEARSAAAAAARARSSCLGASPFAATSGLPAEAAAAGAVEDPSTTAAAEKTPQQISDEEVDFFRLQAASARRLSVEQQQHGQGPLRTSDEDTGIAPGCGSGMHQENLTYTGELDRCGSTAVPSATSGLAAVETHTDGGRSNPQSQAASCGELLEKPQDQQQQTVNGEREQDSPDASETSSTPVTPFAGPDPLSGDAPLSPRLEVPSSRGMSRIVTTSAMSFLLSVRHQLEAEAAVQQDRQQDQRQLEHPGGDASSHDLHEPGLCKEGGEATEEDSQAVQQHQQQQQQLEQQKQQQLNAEEPQKQLDEAAVSPSSNHQQQQEVDSEQTPGEPHSVAEAEGDDALAAAAASAMAGAATSSRRSSGAPSETPYSEASPFKYSSRNSHSRSADLGSTSSRSSCTSVLVSSGKTISANEGNSTSSNPPWRAQWRALDALTNRLLQGLPRALTVIAEGEGGSPAAREPEAAIAVAPSAPETREAGAAELYGETEPVFPRISWVDYREERLREVRGPHHCCKCRWFAAASCTCQIVLRFL